MTVPKLIEAAKRAAEWLEHETDARAATPWCNLGIARANNLRAAIAAEEAKPRAAQAMEPSEEALAHALKVSRASIYPAYDIRSIKEVVSVAYAIDTKPAIVTLEPWRFCPSTHCERAQECRSPNECSGMKTALRHATTSPPPVSPGLLATLEELVARWVENSANGTLFRGVRMCANELACIIEAERAKGGGALGDGNHPQRLEQQAISGGDVAQGNHPAVSPSAVSGGTIPDGWKLVPDGTLDDFPLSMLLAGKQALYSCSEDPEIEDARKCYAAMLAAAPLPPTPEGK